MAAGAALWDQAQNLCAELTCSICLSYFSNPVTIVACGHNFCRACLSQWCRVMGREAGCPQCRQVFQEENLIANRALANVVEIAKKLQEKKGMGGEGRVCGKHQEPLKLFCKEDEVLVCVVCDRAKEHRAHEVIPMEEAPHDYKKRIANYLTNLKKLQEEIRTCKSETCQESQDLLKQTKASREKTVLDFRLLHKFLDEQEKLLLAQMDMVEKEIARKRDEHMAKLSEELFCLQNIIRELEKKCLQPAHAFLQDIKSTLQRCEARKEFKKSVVFPLELKWRIWDFWDINPFLESVMKQFKDKLVSGLTLQKANVTLDPDTAHPSLVLSQDCKSGSVGEPYQILPSNPERVDGYGIVLGREGFVSGRHFWEVVVKNKGDWGIGVAKESGERKDKFFFIPKMGVWMSKLGNQYKIYQPPYFVSLSLKRELKRIRVTLNYEGGQVAFFDADSATLLFTYSPCSFSGETILPLFRVLGKTHFKLSP